MIDTFSSNSLKLLEKSTDEFKARYADNLYLFKTDSRAVLGQKFHSLICAYIKGFDIEKFEKSLNDNELNNWITLKEKLKNKKENFIKTEYPFLIKNMLNDKAYYLTGRFDAIYKDDKDYTIYDWKTLNLPKNPECDMQSIVYLYCAGEIFKTNKIKMKYLSIEKQTAIEINYKNAELYKGKIEAIISKIL